MSQQDENRGHVIISEAALLLALADKQININSLLNELELMATESCRDDRLSKICEARRWLREFLMPGLTTQHEPYLQILTGMNE